MVTDQALLKVIRSRRKPKIGQFPPPGYALPPPFRGSRRYFFRIFRSELNGNSDFKKRIASSISGLFSTRSDDMSRRTRELYAKIEPTSERVHPAIALPAKQLWCPIRRHTVQ